jgi:solute:Na+ symporter, SSS family
MAIIVSTADSFLLVPATNLTRDIYQRHITPNAPERRVVLISRAMVLLLGFIAYLLVDQFPTILAAAFTAYLIYGASITPGLLAAFLWKRATGAGAVASIVTGGGVTLVWTFYLSRQEYFGGWHPMLQEVTYPAVTLSILALIVVSLATPKPTAAQLEPFYRTVDEPDTDETAAPARAY